TAPAQAAAHPAAGALAGPLHLQSLQPAIAPGPRPARRRRAADLTQGLSRPGLGRLSGERAAAMPADRAADVVGGGGRYILVVPSRPPQRFLKMPPPRQPAQIGGL